MRRNWTKNLRALDAEPFLQALQMERPTEGQQRALERANRLFGRMDDAAVDSIGHQIGADDSEPALSEFDGEGLGQEDGSTGTAPLARLTGSAIRRRRCASQTNYDRTPGTSMT